MLKRLKSSGRLIQLGNDALYRSCLVSGDRVKVVQSKGCYALLTVAEFERLIRNGLSWLDYAKGLARGKRERRNAAGR